MSRYTSLLRYSFSRLALFPLMLWVISTLVFILLRVAPGDPVDAILGNRASDEAKDALREELGLNISLIAQYTKFIIGLLKGDLGEALANQEPVKDIIYKSLPASLELGLTALFIAIFIGLLIGFIGIVKPEGKTDLAGRLYGISTYAIPPFWAAMMAQIFFGVILGWLPVGGRFPPGMNQPQGTGFLIADSIFNKDWEALKGTIRYLLLPASTLGILLSGVFSRTIRINMAKILQSDYIQAAESRGLKKRRILLKHALPNALLPFLTIAGITIASLIGGALLIEITFSWPGLALRLQEAINQRDYPVVQGIVVVIAALVVLISLIVDFIIAIIDPRINY